MRKSLLFIVVACVLACGRVNYDLLATEDGQTTTPQDGGVDMGDSNPGSRTDADVQLRTCRDNTNFDCFGQSLSVVGGSIQAFGRLEEFSNVHTPSCGAGSGEYRVEFENINGPITARFRVDAAFDTLIYALSDGCGGQELACENNNGGSNEELIIDLAAGQEILIVVEGLYECGSLTVIQDTP